MIVIVAISRQPWRLTVATDSAPPLSAGQYAVARKDGGYLLCTVTRVWSVGVNTVELSLSEPLATDVIYVVSLPFQSGAPTYEFRPGQLSPAPAPLPVGEDPEADAYGVDIAWLSGKVTAKGDLIQARGRQCLVNDIVTIGVIMPGEIFHRPSDGGGLPSKVNGAGVGSNISSMKADLKRQWLKDSRIKSVDSIEVQVNSDGKTFARASLTEAVSGQTIPTSIPGTTS